MIPGSRGPAPPHCGQDATRWLSEFLVDRKRDNLNTASTFWSKVRRTANLKKYARQLHASFNGKCAFCESHVQPAAFPQIEHFLPKSNPRFEHLMFAWDNWLLVCPACNTFKGDFYSECDGESCLIDPTRDDPDQHVAFHGASILYKTERGRITVQTVRLDRNDLDIARARWLAVINCLCLLMVTVDDAKDPVRSMLIWTMQDDAPFAGMTRNYLKKRTPKLAQPAMPHARIQFSDPVKEIMTILDKYQSILSELA